MHFLAFIPGLIISASFAIQSGNWLLLGAMLFSMLATSLLRSRSTTNVELEISTNGQIRANGRLLSSFPLLWPAVVRDEVIRLVTAPNSPAVHTAYDSLRKAALDSEALPVGVNRSLQHISAQVNQHHPHLLLIGPTGSGKSVFLKNLAKNCRLMIDVDFKGGRNLASLPALMRLGNLDSEQADFWKRVNLLLDERERHCGPTTPALYFVVDELAAVISSASEASKTIERIATRGRSGRVFLIAASQSLAGISRSIILNCHHRVLLGAVDAIDRTQLGLKTKRDIRQMSDDLLVGEYSTEGASEEFYFPRPSATELETPNLSSGVNPLGG